MGYRANLGANSGRTAFLEDEAVTLVVPLLSSNKKGFFYQLAGLDRNRR
jgi:hypothetical protein